MRPHVDIKIRGAHPRLANGLENPVFKNLNFFFLNYGTLLVKLRLLTLDEISNVKELTLDSSDAFELKKNVISCFKTSNRFFHQIHRGHGLAHNL